MAEAIDALGENPLPSLLVVTPKGDDALLATSLQGMPQVDLVRRDAQWRQRLDGWLRFGTRLVQVLALLLGLGALPLGIACWLRLRPTTPAPELIRLLARTASHLALFGLLLSVGLLAR